MSAILNKRPSVSHHPSKRHVLTLQEKVQVLKFMDSHPNVPITELCAKFASNPRTLKRIFDRRDALLQLAPGDRRLCRTRITKGTCQPVEICLLKWMDTLKLDTVALSNHTLQARAKFFLSIVKLYLPNAPSLAASNGWINRFKIRNSIDLKQMNISRTNNYREELQPSRDRIQQVTSNYDPNDVFTVNSTMLYYSFLPLIHDQFNENNNNMPPKDKLSIFLCSNASGTDKLLPSVLLSDEVDKSKYEHFLLELIQGSNGWVSQCTFTSFFNYFQNFIGIKRKVLLVLSKQYKESYDSAKLKELYPNIQVVFLPENHSNYMQPFNLGIIKQFKSQYRSSLIKYAVSSNSIQLGNSLNSIINIEFDKALELIQQAWESINMDTITSSWQLAELLPYSNSYFSNINMDMKANPLTQLFDSNPHLNRFIGSFDIIDRVYMDVPGPFPTEDELLFVEESLSFYLDSSPSSPPTGQAKPTTKFKSNNNIINNLFEQYDQCYNQDQLCQTGVSQEGLIQELFADFNNMSFGNSWNNAIPSVTMDYTNISQQYSAPLMTNYPLDQIYNQPNYFLNVPECCEDFTKIESNSSCGNLTSPPLSKDDFNNQVKCHPSKQEINDIDMLLSLLKSHLTQGFQAPDTVQNALDTVSKFVHQFDNEDSK